MKRRGLSLLEILLALVILGLAIAPLLGLSLRSNQGAQVSLDEIEATAAANAVLAALRAAPWELLATAETAGEVPLERLPAPLLEALRLPPTPLGMSLLAQLEPAEVPEPAEAAGLPEELRAQAASLRRLCLIRVRCRFATRASGETPGRRRDREVLVTSLVAGAARR